MKPTVLLRIASVVTLVHAVMHTFGGVFGKPSPGAAEVAFAAMQSNHFLVMGLSKTYAGFYRGLGLAISIFLTAEGIVFWQLGSLAKTEAHRLRPILATFTIAYFVFAVNSYLYFFQAPAVTEVLIGTAWGWRFIAPNRRWLSDVNCAGDATTDGLQGAGAAEPVMQVHP